MSQWRVGEAFERSCVAPGNQDSHGDGASTPPSRRTIHQTRRRKARMPLDSEKKRLEARLLTLLNQALRERNRDDIVATSLELGALYYSGDLYDKSEECFRGVLEEPVVQLARSEEKAQAEAGIARVLLTRGHLTLAREAFERAERHLDEHGDVVLEIRKLRWEHNLLAGQYGEVVEAIETMLSEESLDSLGDARVDIMILEARSRRLLGQNRDAARLLEKALEMAEGAGYEAGTADARSEIGALLTSLGQFKRAQDVLEEALRSDEGMGRQYRMDRDRMRLGNLLVQMGRWDEGEANLREAHASARELRTLENRLASQLGLATLLAYRGNLAEANNFAREVMEVARAAGFVRLQVEGLVTTSGVLCEADQGREALEAAQEAEALYARLAEKSDCMVRVHAALGRAQGRLGNAEAAFDHLMRACNLAREIGNDYERHRVESVLGLHFRSTGDPDKAATVLSQAASDLGGLGAKYHVAVARLDFADLLAETSRTRQANERGREVKLARSNLFEARRLFEGMGAESRLEQVTQLETRLAEEPASSD